MCFVQRLPQPFGEWLPLQPAQDSPQAVWIGPAGGAFPPWAGMRQSLPTATENESAKIRVNPRPIPSLTITHFINHSSTSSVISRIHIRATMRLCGLLILPARFSRSRATIFWISLSSIACSVIRPYYWLLRNFHVFNRTRMNADERG